MTLLVRRWPVIALLVLALNDHLLKGSHLLPGVLTGKLSDFAGLFYFPLLLVTVLNLLGAAIAGWRGRPLRWGTPTEAQLLAACLSTGLVFSLVKLSPGARDLAARAVALLQFWTDAPTTRLVLDPTDLLALVMLGSSWAAGRAAIARVPPGRLALARSLSPGSSMADPLQRARQMALGDVRRLLRPPKRAVLDQLTLALATGASNDDLDLLLVELRTPSAKGGDGVR